VLAAGKLEVGERFELVASSGDLARQALVVRNGTPGLYGLSFELALEEAELSQAYSPSAEN
jgi:hypothetical protein